MNDTGDTFELFLILLDLFLMESGMDGRLELPRSLQGCIVTLLLEVVFGVHVY